MAILLAMATMVGCASLTSQPEPVSDLYARSMRAYAAKDYRLAALLLERVVERVPGDAEAWFRLGNSYGRTDRPRLAVAAYQQAVLKRSSHERAWYNLGIVQTRIAANSFLEMSAHLEPQDPLRQVALDMAEALMTALEERSRPNFAAPTDAEPPPETAPTIVERPRPTTAEGAASSSATDAGELEREATVEDASSADPTP